MANKPKEATGWDELPPGVARRPIRRRPRIANAAMGTIRRKGYTNDPALRRETPE